VFLAPKIALRVFAAMISKKVISQVTAIKESKGMLLASAEFVRKLRTRISCFLLISAAKPACGFSRSVNKGL
jgi:hypothetical protein